MGGGKTVLFMKRLKQGLPEEWDDSMPLPGDIIEGLACEEDDDLGGSLSFLSRAALSSTLSSGSLPVSGNWRLFWLSRTHDRGHYSIAQSMACFSAVVSSGAPLVFVNIQTEQISTLDKANPIAKEISRGRQQTHPMNFHLVQGIRQWFLPGIAEVSIDIESGPEATRFGMDIKRTEEGFICIYSVASGAAAECAGLGYLHEEANAKGHLRVISRLEGKSAMPSSVGSSRLINCHDHNEIRDVLTKAIERMEGIRIHVMAWLNHTRSASPRVMVSTLWPPSGVAPTLPL
ncbi:hypothetical protein CDL15_Pgr022083 [Punica granatum]|uniref:Uncharacterized protein n=1 Tax=Punica granatum TaxID=22663 RepID=A0A218VT05_PUNGR|nr:hypothetical protein CDL15_Pgr022083 [Punica granatum]PKI58306.1 hypothetical protein CRG98_021312 [Punica granatum]